jgi:hypothetical protein
MNSTVLARPAGSIEFQGMPPERRGAGRAVPWRRVGYNLPLVFSMAIARSARRALNTAAFRARIFVAAQRGHRAQLMAGAGAPFWT